MEASMVGPAKRNRLLAAFEDVERLPVFVGSRDALFQAVEGNGSASPSAVAAAIESDPALCAMVLRLANQRNRPGVATAESALDHVGTAELRDLAGSAQTFDVFGGDGLWGSHPERFRLHALAVQQMALGVARETHHPAADRIAVAALLHDIGKLVLIAGYAQAAGLGAGLPPEERVRLELRTFGLTHPMAGGVLARRWCLPSTLESSIAGHHEEGVAGDPAIIRLADMLVHHAHGVAVSPRSISTAARLAGVDRHALRRLAGWPGHGEVARRAEPSLLSRRELEALRGLAHGKVYKEIAADLGLAVSTVRSHLSRTYDKLGARDRAQAVLIATERGWI
jgi:HD-like signal output (HDOD) protein/DNA-binding CsgD family transcriptional regulator